MLSCLEMCFNHARRVSVKTPLLFRPGLNVIVGPNGSGKSTILKAIYSCNECKSTMAGDTHFHYFNSETMNPRTDENPARNMTNMALRIRSLFSSHGEIMKKALTALPVQRDDCLLLDEPETGQDLDGILKIRVGLNTLCAEGGQVVLASHHPVFWRDCNVIELEKGYMDTVLGKYRVIARP